MNTRRQSSSIRGRIVRLTISATLMACAAQAHAAIRAGESTLDSVAAGMTPELVLIIWDPVKEISYTKDLGISVYKEYASGNASTNLYVYGQQDTSYQKLFDPLNTDANFQTFLTKSTNVANQIWAIVGVESDTAGAPLAEGATSIFTTLKHASSTGTVDPEYTTLLKTKNVNVSDAGGLLSDMFAKTNTKNGTCATGGCETNYDANISYLNAKGQTGYAGAFFNAAGGLPTGGGASEQPSIFNAVNKSSWFYAATTTSDIGEEKVAVDEFDNLSHDAYWGLGVDSNGNYILSYTMEATLTQAQTAAGSLLRLRTDFAAYYGKTRLIDVPTGDTLDLGGHVTAVPEPATWGLMGLGLAVLAGRARRRRA